MYLRKEHFDALAKGFDERKSLGLTVRFFFFPPSLHSTSLRSGESAAFSELSSKGIVSSISGTENRPSSSPAASGICGVCCTARVVNVCLC